MLGSSRPRVSVLSCSIWLLSSFMHSAPPPQMDQKRCSSARLCTPIPSIKGSPAGVASASNCGEGAMASKLGRAVGSMGTQRPNSEGCAPMRSPRFKPVSTLAISASFARTATSEVGFCEYAPINSPSFRFPSIPRVRGTHSPLGYMQDWVPPLSPQVELPKQTNWPSPHAQQSCSKVSPSMIPLSWSLIIPLIMPLNSPDAHPPMVQTILLQIPVPQME